MPYFRLEEGASVDIAAPTLDEISGEHGYRMLPDILISSVEPSDLDILIVPGGYPDGAPATVRDNSDAQAIAQSFFLSGQPVAAICRGPWLLASAGVIEGRRLASYWEDGVPDDIRRADGTWENAPIVIDKNLVTSRWPPDLAVFCGHMIDLAQSWKRSSESQSYGFCTFR